MPIPQDLNDHLQRSLIKRFEKLHHFSSAKKTNLGIKLGTKSILTFPKYEQLGLKTKKINAMLQGLTEPNPLSVLSTLTAIMLLRYVVGRLNPTYPKT